MLVAMAGRGLDARYHQTRTLNRFEDQGHLGNLFSGGAAEIQYHRPYSLYNSRSRSLLSCSISQDRTRIFSCDRIAVFVPTIYRYLGYL